MVAPTFTEGDLFRECRGVHRTPKKVTNSPVVPTKTEHFLRTVRRPVPTRISAGFKQNPADFSVGVGFPDPKGFRYGIGLFGTGDPSPTLALEPFAKMSCLAVGTAVPGCPGKGHNFAGSHDKNETFPADSPKACPYARMVGSIKAPSPD